jgi:hypothetical protein
LLFPEIQSALILTATGNGVRYSLIVFRVGGALRHGHRAAGWLVHACVFLAGAGACGRVGYDPAPSVSDGAAAMETGGGHDRPPEGPGAEADTRDTEADRQIPADLAPDGLSDAGMDQGRLDTGPVVPASCAEPGARLDPATGHCYFQPSMSAGLWEDARAACEGQGAHLATLSSPQEQAFAVTVLAGQERWIGLFRTMTGPHQWVTGEPVDFLAWAPLEPDEPADSRSRLAPDGWRDTDVRRRFLALCERDP